MKNLTAFIQFITIFVLFANFANGQDRIVGGAFQNINSVPYQVLLFPSNYYCGGSLLSKHWILSAAHCTNNLDASQITAYFGIQKMSEAYFSTSYAIDFLAQYPYYDPVSQDNDIVMLRTATDVTFTPTIQPIQLQRTMPGDGSDVKVSGYGDTAFEGSSSDFLLSAVIKIMNFETCNWNYGGGLTDNMICAGVANYKIDSCQGDSGGPLVYNGKLLGVVSFGNGCATDGYAGVYTKVPNYIDWIEHYLKY